MRNEACEISVDNCEIDCEEKLEEVRVSFRRCFSVPESYSIEQVLEKAKAPPKGQESCYQKMKSAADKYKRQSLNEAFSLRERLKAQDIVRCEDIQKVGTEKNLGDFALNMCYRAQEQKQSREEARRVQEEAQRQAEQAQQEVVQAGQEFQSKAQGAGSAVYQGQGMDFNEERAGSNAVTRQAKNQPAEADKKSSSAGKALLGAGALAGTALGVKALTAGNSKTASQTGSATSTKPSVQKESPKPSVQKNTPALSAKKAQPKQSKRNSVRSKSSPRKNIQVAQAVNPTGSCPVNMPSIKSAVVFQSVEAPQIEPINQQEIQNDPNNPKFSSYDLVMGKPAGILVDLDRNQMDRKREFGLDVIIGGDSKKRRKCFHDPLNSQMVEEHKMIAGKESSCSFTRRHLIRKGDYKFFPLPMHEKFLNADADKASHFVTLILYPRSYSKHEVCLKKVSFYINIIPTSELNLGFARIYGGRNCRGYPLIASQKLSDFVDSTEVKHQIKDMFPLKTVISSVLRRIQFIGFLKYTKVSYIHGRCDNRLDRHLPQYTSGFINDLNGLETQRRLYRHHKLFTVVPKDYFIFHRYDDPKDRRDDFSGIVFPPQFLPCGLFGIRFPDCFKFGSFNVAFIVESAHKTQLNTGVISHELGHTLGQNKEFYLPRYPTQNLPDECWHFRGSPIVPCYRYRMPLSLSKTQDGWEFKKKKYSIMSNRGSINDIWIDRETHQKSFSILSRNSPDVYANETSVRPDTPFNDNTGIRSQAVISGFYYKERDSFVAPQIKLVKTKAKSPSLKKFKKMKGVSAITFVLKEKGKTLQSIESWAFPTRMELLYRNKPPESRPFPLSHTMAIFNLPKNSEKRDLKIFVLNQNGRKIYSTPVPKPKKTKTDQVAVVDKSRHIRGK